MSGVPEARVPQVNVIRTRVALLDLNGSPHVGANSSYVSDALSTATLSPQYEAGDEIKEKNANGVVLLDYQADPSMLRADLSMEFITTDPILMQILQSQGKSLAGAFGIGWAYPPIGAQAGQLSIEFWALRINGGVVDSTYPYAHWALPYVKNMQLGDRNFAAANGKSVFSAQCYENQNWFDGPGNDWPTDAEPADRVAQWVTATSIPAVSSAGGTIASS